MCVPLGLKKRGDFTVSEGHGHPIKALHPIVVLAATIHKRLPQVLLYQNLFFGQNLLGPISSSFTWWSYICVICCPFMHQDGRRLLSGCQLLMLSTISSCPHWLCPNPFCQALVSIKAEQSKICRKKMDSSCWKEIQELFEFRESVTHILDQWKWAGTHQKTQWHHQSLQKAASCLHLMDRHCDYALVEGTHFPVPLTLQVFPSTCHLEVTHSKKLAFVSDTDDETLLDIFGPWKLKIFPWTSNFLQK